MTGIAAVAKFVLASLVVIACLGLVWFAFFMGPTQYADWRLCFRPAARNWRHPYQAPIWPLYNPPWLVVILHPFALLPPRAGAAAFMVLSMVIVAAYVRSPLKFLLVSISAPMVALLTQGQVDAVPVAGLLAPDVLSVPLLLVKPQAVYLAALRRLNLRSASFTLLVIALAAVVWGPWWQHLLRGTENIRYSHNLSFFPYSAFAGVVFLLLGLSRKSDALLCVASICLSPYYQTCSLLPLLAAVARQTSNYLLIIAVVGGSWLYWWLA